MDGTKKWPRLLAKNIKKQDKEKKKFVQKLGGLALLPSERISEVLDEIYLDAILESKNSEDDDAEYDFCEFVDEYFIPYWMERIRPENFSVFDEIDRTNNKIESYHSKLPRFLGIRPILTAFLRKYQYFLISFLLIS